MKSARLGMVGAIAAVSMLLAACGGTANTDAKSGDRTYKIGITQIVSHPSLDASRDGFKKALADAGLKVEYDEQNAQGDQATATSIANKFATDKKDLVLAIATPTAQAAAQAITDTPILFTAVTDPVSAQLVKSLQAPGANVTGTTDMNPVAQQVGLVKQLVPGAKTLGVIYSSGEVNSEVQVKLAREAATKEGLTLKEVAVSNSSEVQQGAQSLSGVDAIYVPTDNVVVSALESVLQVAETNKIPVIAGEGDSVKRGAVATYGIDYGKLGQQTGQMAVKILTQKADPATMPVESQSDVQLVVNTAAAQRMGVTIPADLLAKAGQKYN
ncbi:putative ABC transport system substrate-binding protein [Raineyella antarctica]|uniref:Putative ABC transport system substrate-binding protein n=1 Tax=Raineyella antarctica TaxID=1577474 RepID=A0A1G6HZ74_9ACTN|nr:ABC transporter substrate-binding protein [Raineyella antarctica]SDB99443.1 putative ABC transport system substrate-binding protein [Raineyella antarctica]